jgi:hypothetical protein
MTVHKTKWPSTHGDPADGGHGGSSTAGNGGGGGDGGGGAGLIQIWGALDRNGVVSPPLTPG